MNNTFQSLSKFERFSNGGKQGREIISSFSLFIFFPVPGFAISETNKFKRAMWNNILKNISKMTGYTMQSRKLPMEQIKTGFKTKVPSVARLNQSFVTKCMAIYI